MTDRLAEIEERAKAAATPVVESYVIGPNGEMSVEGPSMSMPQWAQDSLYLLAELKRLREENATGEYGPEAKAAAEKAETPERKLAIAREALEKYANEGCWQWCDWYGSGISGEKSMPGFILAKKALEEIK